MFKVKNTIVLGLCGLCLVSCMQMGSEVVNWMEVTNSDEAFGTYHFLEQNGAEVYLPDEFQPYSIVNYQKVLDSVLSEEAFMNETRRINSLQEMDGGLYLFFDKTTGSTCTVNTMPYSPMTRQDAKYLLGMIRMNNERALEDTPYTFEKLSAKYNGHPEKYVFKSLNKISDATDNFKWFNSTFIVTANNKTILLQLSTPFEAYFSPFIEKTKM